MERVLKHAGVKSLFLLISLLAVAPSALATTAILPADDEMIVAARAIVRGKVVSVEVGLDGQNRIFTYVTLKVQEVLKGQITERRIVIKEPGGEVGNRGSIVFGTPRFARGDKVLLYLDTWQDGSLRVHQMFLGRFSIVQDAGSDELLVTRNVPDANVSVLGQSTGGPITNRMELTRYTEMVRNRLAANLEHSREFEAKVYGNTPVLARPIEYKSAADGGDLSPQFHLWNPPLRWFQADSGQSVVFKTNPDGAPNPQAVADAAAAMNAWSTVPGCSLRVDDGGATQGCGLFALDGENTISFNNCDGYFSGSGSCSSGILAVASIANYDRFQTRVVNGVTFSKALESNISFNPFSACNFSNHCNVQEITTHEMGHALGLHHSWDPTFGGSPSASDQIATMYWIAHFDGRCASLKTDDVNGITFIYPSSGGGPGPLTIVTSSLAGGTVGTPYSQSVSASGGTLPYTWSLVQGQGTLPPGLSLSAGGVITGTPTTAGTNNFTVRVTDNAAATAQRALGIVVNAAGGGGALNSQFVSQTVPTPLQPGQAFTVNMKFLNTGTQTWSGPEYYFASQNPTLNQTWGGNGVSLFGFAAASGEVLDVTFTATAPVTPGAYNFQWQMYQNGGVGFFGQMSTNVVIQVGAALTDNATFASQTVPSMMAGQTYSVSVTMNNTGTSTWTAGNYYLGSQNAQGNTTWGLNRTNLSSSVAPGGQGTFSFNVTAPSTPGTYNFQWQMAKDGAGYFGSMSTNLSINVAQPRHAAMIDVDQDGSADLGFYRDGLWGFLKSSQGYGLGSADFFSWGGSGLAPIIADFDGDGKSDFAYIVPPSGGQSAAYAILKSSTNYDFSQVQFAAAGFPALGDTPVFGDFDGDGKADPGIWRASQGVWIIPQSSSNYTSYLFCQWGQSGDTPIVGDVDGDGKTDMGFYRNGLWGFLKSSQGYSLAAAQFFSWGGVGLTPIVADFDGDGKVDLAYVAPPSGGQSAVYSILQSSTGYSFGQGQVLFVPAGFPSLGDTPLVADFDGDGKADPGIWRASQGVWIVPRSSTNYTSFVFAQWGQSGDVALPGTLTQY